MTIATYEASGAELAGATRTTSAVPVPAGVASGKIVLVHLYTEITSAITATGFTEITFSPTPQTTAPHSITRQRVFWKRATGADTGTYSFTHASSYTSGGATLYSGVIGSGTPVEVLASAQRSSNGTVTPTVTGITGGADRLLVYGATNFYEATWTAPSGFTKVLDNPTDETMVAVKGQAAAGSTGPLTSSSSSSGEQTVTLIALIPASVTVDTTAPSVPTGVNATATGDTTATISWNPSTDDIGVTGYTVYRGGVSIASGVTSTSYSDSGLTGSTAYSWTVSAQDAAGNTSAQSSAATATTAVAVPPALTVTATVETDHVPPRVRLNIADTRTTKATAVTVTRIDPDGSVSTVKTADGNPLTLTVSGSSNVGLLYDYLMPLGSGITYSTAEAPGTTSAEVIVGSEVVWLVHPGLPAISMPITVASLGARTYPTMRGVHRPMGRASAVVVTDGTRKAAEYDLSIYTADDGEREALSALLADSQALLLNVPSSKGWGVTHEFISIGDVTETRVSRVAPISDRIWSMSVTVVDQPVGGTQAERTYVDVLADFSTYAAVRTNYANYLAVLAGP